MKNEKKEEKEAADPPRPPEARIADSLSGIKDALYILLFITLLGQCSSPFQGESKEAKALGGIEYELRLIHEDLASNRDATTGVGASLREIEKHLSDINGTIWNKSCSR